VRQLKLLDAIEGGDAGAVQAALDRLDTRELGEIMDSALRLAAALGRSDVMSMIHDRVPGSVGRIDALELMHEAAHGGHMDLLAWLVEHGGGVDARDSGGGTALMYAAKAGHLEVVAWLLARGANADLHDDRGRRAGDWATLGPKGRDMAVLLASQGDHDGQARGTHH
jgi:ankyrin repeat protein